MGLCNCGKLSDIANVVPKRFVVVTLATLGVLWSFCLRFNLTVAIVAMVSAAAKNKTIIKECPAIGNVTVVDFQGEFDWDTEFQGIVLGSLYYGYISTQIAGGRLSEKFGARRVFGYGLAANSILALLTVVGTRQIDGSTVSTSWGYCWYTEAANIEHSHWVRFFSKLSSLDKKGMILPAVPVITQKWAPVPERARMNAFIFSGIYMGLVTSQFLSGFLSESGILGGWPSVFYVMGACGLISASLWLFFVSDSPSEHPTITKEEREYIKANTKQISKRKSTPWREMLTSLPAWAIYICHIGNGWSLYALGSFLPIYIEQVLHFKIKDNGLLSALPYALTFVFTNLGGILSDFLLRKAKMKTATVRKIMVGTGGFGLVSFTVAAGYTGCDVTVNIVFLTLSLGLNGLVAAGLFVNPQDIAGTYAGTLFGISNTFSSIPGFVASYITGYVLGEKPTLTRWRTVFLLTGGLGVFCTVFFIVFAAGDIQPWAIDRRQSNQLSDDPNDDGVQDKKEDLL